MKIRPSQIQQAAATSGQALVWNGSEWTPTSVSGSGDPGWTTVSSFSNSYTDAGAGNWPSPSYRKLSSGVVILRGLAGTASGTNNTAMFTLPAGYHPGKYQFFTCAADGATNVTAYVAVHSNGDVVMLDPKPTTDVDLSGVAFYAE